MRKKYKEKYEEEKNQQQEILVKFLEKKMNGIIQKAVWGRA